MKGVAWIGVCFPSLLGEAARIETWFRLLRDLPDELFTRGVLEFCKNQKEIYPGTNPIALIRSYAREVWPEFLDSEWNTSEGLLERKRLGLIREEKC